MLIYAKQPIYYIIRYHSKKIRTLYLAKQIEKKEYARLMKMGFEIKRIPNEVATKMCKGGIHQGYLAEIEPLELVDSKLLLDKKFLLILAGVTDVGNIGSLIRSCYALGVDGIIATGIKQLPLEAIIRVSTGAALDFPIALEKNIYNLMNDLKTSGFHLYGADMDGKEIKDLQIKSKKVLILGSEGEGVSKRLKSKLDTIVSIKMKHTFDSLNVAVAGAILVDRMRDE